LSDHDTSKYAGVVDQIALNRLQMTLNDTVQTMQHSVSRQWMNQQFDGRRDIGDECGFPKTNSITAQMWQEKYERNPAINRITEIMPKESWKLPPTVYENEKTKAITPFEVAWDALGRDLREDGTGYYKDEEGSLVWSYLLDADILSGIGRFGALFLGLNDDTVDLSKPAPGFEEQNSAPLVYNSKTKKITLEYNPKELRHYSLTINKKATKGRKLKWLRAFGESCLMISRWEHNPSSPRFGSPIEYLVTFFDPNESYTGIGLNIAMKRVHWSRMIHIADNYHMSVSNRNIAKPRGLPVLDNALNLEKIYGGSGEGYWKMCMAILAAETHPQMGGDVAVNENQMKDLFENMMNGLQRYGLFKGMSLKSVGPTVSDPTPHAKMNLEAICYRTGVPMRIFLGAERGEQASTQDDANWNDRCKHRQIIYNTPRLITPFVDRLIRLGVLPEPGKAGQRPEVTMYDKDGSTTPNLSPARTIDIRTEGGFSVYWPDLTSQSAAERADVFSKRMAGFAQAVSGKVTELLTERDLLVREAGYDEEEADAILDATQKAQEQDMEASSDLADEHGFVPKPPEGFRDEPAEQEPFTQNLREGLEGTWSLEDDDADEAEAGS
jgi:hypothetical protein